MHIFTVEGYGAFPLSMLRFDCAWPYTDEDANNIELALRGEWVGRWEITLQSGSRHAPTEGRWESFNCSVESGK